MIPRSRYWLTDDGKSDAVVLALNLLPFAGIAFLWFIGVVRDRIGPARTGSSPPCSWAAGCCSSPCCSRPARSQADSCSRRDDHPAAEVWSFGRRVSFTLLTVYAMRMAAVFAISTTTIATRLGLAPRWLTVLGLATGVILLFGCGSSPGSRSSSPAWVFVFSVQHPGGVVPLEGAAQVAATGQDEQLTWCRRWHRVPSAKRGPSREESMAEAAAQRKELKNTGYEIFIGILSILSIVNLVLLYAIKDESLDTVLFVMNGLLSAHLPGRLHLSAVHRRVEGRLLLPPVRLGRPARQPARSSR